jgi:hypothetical protein
MSATERSRASADAVGREEEDAWIVQPYQSLASSPAAAPERCFYCNINFGWYACKDGRFVGRAKPEGWRIGDQPADWKVIQ